MLVPHSSRHEMHTETR